MLLVMLVATAVHWVTLPNAKSPDGYVGWKLDEKQVLALDRRLQLPEGAYPREQYVRYYAGHIAPDGKKTLFVRLKHERLIVTHPSVAVRKPDNIYINYTAKGHASVGGGFHSGCLSISGAFDAHFQPLTPLHCSNEFVAHPPTEGTPPKP